jgi:phosphoribosylglycinamide formyltransferase-1
MPASSAKCVPAVVSFTIADVRSPLKLAILISGRGSNMLAIAHACAAGTIHASLQCVIADRASAAGINAAQELGLHTQVIEARAFADKADFEAALAEAIDTCGAQLVVLAGFMKILSPAFATHYEGRMLNIHPSLLPRYKGLHTHRRVLEAGDSEHGVTVHYVTPELDAGPLLMQARIAVLPGDTEDALSARIHTLEHIIYPRIIGALAKGELEWRAGQPWYLGKPLAKPLQLEEYEV